MIRLPSVHPALRSVFGLFALTISVSILRVIWFFDQDPGMSFSSKILILGLGTFLNCLFYGAIAYHIHNKSSHMRYGYSALTLLSFAYYCVVALYYYYQTGSLEHTDFNNLITLAPQLLAALLLFNPDLDDYFTTKHPDEGHEDITPEVIKNLT